MNHAACICVVAMSANLFACAELPKNMPLLFAETRTIGIGISASTSDKGGDFTLGYKAKDIAIVPVVVVKSDGTVEQIKGKESHPQGTKNAGEFEDSYSVLGQFDSKTGTAGHEVGLGQFFATGQAAAYLAEGFKAKLGGAAAEGKDTQKKSNGAQEGRNQANDGTK